MVAKKKYSSFYRVFVRSRVIVILYLTFLKIYYTAFVVVRLVGVWVGVVVCYEYNPCACLRRGQSRLNLCCIFWHWAQQRVTTVLTKNAHCRRHDVVSSGRGDNSVIYYCIIRLKNRWFFSINFQRWPDGFIRHSRNWKTIVCSKGRCY